jgi:hypothetical protein
MKDEEKMPEDNLSGRRKFFPRYTQNHPAIVSMHFLTLMVRNVSDLGCMIKLHFSNCLRVSELDICMLKSLRSLSSGREDGYQ